MKQKIKKKNTKTRSTDALRDLIIIAVITILVFVLSYFFNVFVFLVRLFQKYPKSITYIDEIITGFLTLTIGFAIFSLRRWLELKEETSKRIKLQEELIRIYHTKAETERIIARQLRVEIEERKKVEKIP